MIRGKELSQKQDSKAAMTRVRTISGLILFVYVLFHLLTHSLGLISVEILEEARLVVKTFWRWPPMSIILYGALAAHFGSALIRVYQRRSLAMPASEWAQLILGLSIPFLLVVHVMGTRYSFERYGINDTYTYMLLSTFVFSPISGWLNASGLIAAWVHGSIGLHMWMKVKNWYRPFHYDSFLVLSVLVPSFSLAGYLFAGREIMPFARDGEFMGAYYENLNLTDDAVWGFIARDTDAVRYVLIALVGGVIVARLLRTMLRRRSEEISIEYIDGPTIKQPLGSSLLEMSNLARVPHASICGGRGRCSTCRVRILSSLVHLDKASEFETKVLERVQAPDDVRLACQLYPQQNMRVARLLPADATMENLKTVQPWATGSEKIITVVFADLRDFTRTSESRLPFDVVYLINQFSKAMGSEVERQGGRIDKFLGDGFMALFGIEGTAEEGAKGAIDAAEAMIKALEHLNLKLADDLDAPLRMGIGIHSGPVILGEMGYGSSRGLTAIGDTVNTASRLEAATKTLACVICVSEDTMKLASLGAPPATKKQIEVRGKKDKLSVHALKDISPVKALENSGKVIK
ncbi:MAG: adenylate/guanylate cyclase domain-containing protein [Rhizobiaceae bacterium]